MEVLKTMFPTYDDVLLNALYLKYNNVEYVANFVLNDIVRNDDEELLKYITDIDTEARELRKYECKQKKNTDGKNISSYNSGRSKYKFTQKIRMMTMFRRRTKTATTRYMESPLLLDYIPENNDNDHSSTC